jgi:hypothetical protein
MPVGTAFLRFYKLVGRKRFERLHSIECAAVSAATILMFF